MNLGERSVEIIKSGQAATGAYVASPTFPPYAYCWFRDGAFIADAMSRVGEVESAEAFFGWCARTIERHYPHLRTRYKLDGSTDDVEWPNFQLDGFGTWVWSLHEHARRHGRSIAAWDDAADLSLQFVAHNFERPTTDWWEEREGAHASTFACLYGGLAARGHPLAGEARDRALAHAADRIDASLLCLYEPFGVVGNSLLLTGIADALVDPAGGVHRQLEDEYYGGGAWILLTAWLGWADPSRASASLAWIEARATPDGELPEQVAEHLVNPGCHDPWIHKWGPSPCPLLWSHAMYLTLRSATLG